MVSFRVEKINKRETIEIRKHPNPADLSLLMKVAADTVLEIAKMDGALGAQSISLLYVERLYKAIVSRQVRKRK